MPQLVDCLAPMKNKRKASFPTTQQRIVRWEIELGVSNLSIAGPILYYWAIAAAIFLIEKL